MKYAGFKIEQDQDGFFWCNGGESYGYFETIEEAKQSIDQFVYEDRKHSPQ